MIHGMTAAAGGDPVLHGVVEQDEDGRRGGPLPNPTRSLLLGAPASGALVYGRVIDLAGDGGIGCGTRAPARLLFWQREHPCPPGCLRPFLMATRDRPGHRPTHRRRQVHELATVEFRHDDMELPPER